MIKFIRNTALVIVLLMAANGANAEETRTVMEKIIEVTTHKPKENIERHMGDIERDRDVKWEFMERNIDRAVENLFHPVYINIDSYLDYHYSVMGEYKELGQYLADWWSDEYKAQKDIERRIFGRDFTQRYDETIDFLGKEFSDLTRQHIAQIDRYASENIDMKLNPDIFKPVYHSLQSDALIRDLKVGNVIAAMAGVKFTGKLASAIAAKAGSKAAIKASAKGGAKLATKGGAAATGAGAGAAVCAGTVIGAPAAPICALAGAAAAWFATDYVVAKGDEYFTRDNLKHEISTSIDEQKYALESELKRKYREKMDETSRVVVDNFKNTPMSEKRRAERVNALF